MQITAPLLVVPSENSAERFSQLNLKLSVSIADELGLKNTQVVNGLVSEDGKQIQLRTQDWRFFTLPFNGLPYRSASFWFRVEFTPYGVYLRPHAKEASSGVSGSKNSTQALTASQTSKSSSQLEITKPAVEPYVSSSSLAALASTWQSKGIYEFSRLQQLLTQSQLPLVAEALRGLLGKGKKISPRTVYDYLKFSGLFPLKTNEGRADILKMMGLINEQLTNNNSISDLDKDVLRAVIQRISYSQLETLIAKEQGELHYRFTIMLEDQLPAEIVIFKHKEQNRGGRQQLGAELEVSFTDSLPVKFSCLLIGEDSLSLSAWSEDKHFVAILRDGEKSLRASLRDHGIKLENFAIYESLPPVVDKNFYDNDTAVVVEYRV